MNEPAARLPVSMTLDQIRWVEVRIQSMIDDFLAFPPPTTSRDLSNLDTARAVLSALRAAKPPPEPPLDRHAGIVGPRRY